jgi:uridine kinase
MARAISVTELQNKKRKLLDFDGEFLQNIGRPELFGTWIVWGQSGSGKTTFVMMLAKYLTRFGRVCYNSMEEGDSHSMALTSQRVKMQEVKKKIIFLDNEQMPEMFERLRKHKAPQIVIIDSIQYSGMNYAEYKKMRAEFKKTLFIIISHAEGKEPKGKIASDIRYDAFVKIFVQGYKAFTASRYVEDGKPFVIWAKGADKYHGADIL